MSRLLYGPEFQMEQVSGLAQIYDITCFGTERHRRLRAGQFEMNDDPEQIASHLAERYGVIHALAAVRAEIAEAQANGENYRLSIWRDVRRILQNLPGPTNDNY
jgi:hypothetical protein